MLAGAKQADGLFRPGAFLSGFSLVPTSDAVSAARSLERLLRCPVLVGFQGAIHRLHARFKIYAATSPVPLPAPGLIITPEIRLQSEIYLPIAEVAAIFNKLYLSTLTYPPILTSTPFSISPSWADLFAALPSEFQFSANPARLLEALLDDSDLLIRFLFASFLPHRFYGSYNRYPGQKEWLREWLKGRKKDTVRCLDAACCAGEDTYRLVELLLESGFDADGIRIEGWAIEPLEVWAAAHRRLPHDPLRTQALQRETAGLFEIGVHERIRFRCADLRDIHLYQPLPKDEARFDLIICNGLLGGPIINKGNSMRQVVENLAALLEPGGVLLAADRFHGGWKKQNPEEFLGDLFKACGMNIVEAGNGIAAVSATTSWDRGYNGSRWPFPG